MPTSPPAESHAARRRLVADKKKSGKARAWPLFDAIVADAPLRNVNPWINDAYQPDFDTLCRLLGVPLYLESNSQSGVPALALDVWVAYELRRGGLDPDAVWPRAEPPRVVDRDVLRLVHALPKRAMGNEIADKLRRGAGVGGVATASANMLGKNYLKQVDVVMTSWQTGPELLISTKRMDSSFGKNMQNRVEESYGDAKNLSLRHPMASIGFFFSLRSTAHEQAKQQYLWLVDMLIKLAREEDAYDACCLVIPQWEGAGPSDDAEVDTDDTVTGPDDVEIEPVEEEEPVDAVALENLPKVTLRHDLVPDELSARRFFAVMLNGVLDSSPIGLHTDARNLRRAPRMTGI